MITTIDGLNLHTVNWLAQNEKARMVLVHGYAEYARRYDHFAKFLNQHGISVYAFDHSGHGDSEGDEVYADSYDLLLNDLDRFIASLGSSEVPVFVFGHSMGGLIACEYFLSEYAGNHQIRGMILSGPGLMPSKEISALLVKLSGFLGKYFPRMKTIQLDPTAVSSAPKEVEKYINDPKVYSGKWIARTGAELVKMMRHVQTNADKMSIPFFLGHGDSDKLAEIEGSRIFYTNAGSEDKAFKTYEGYYHELVNEPGRQVFMDDVLSWIKERI